MTPTPASVEEAKRIWQSLEGGLGTCADDDVVTIALALFAARQAGALEEAAKHADCCVDREEQLIIAKRLGAQEEREACAVIAETAARSCGGSRTDGDKMKWNLHESHSDAHDACHGALDTARYIRARAAARGGQ